MEAHAASKTIQNIENKSNAKLGVLIMDDDSATISRITSDLNRKLKNGVIICM